MKGMIRHFGGKSQGSSERRKSRIRPRSRWGSTEKDLPSEGSGFSKMVKNGVPLKKRKDGAPEGPWRT